MGKTRTLRKVLGTLLAIVLVVVLAFGAWIGLSAQRAGGLFEQTSNALVALQEHVEAKDYQAAMVSAREAAAYTSEASEELSGVQWDIASRLPALGVDAGVMRSIGSISGKLSNEAIIPVLDGWDALAADGIIVNDQIDFSKIGDKIDQVVALAESLQKADGVVDACSAEANALPASHFDKLNDWVGQVKGAVATVDETLDQLVGVANLVTGASSLFTTFATAAGA